PSLRVQQRLPPALRGGGRALLGAFARWRPRRDLRDPEPSLVRRVPVPPGVPVEADASASALPPVREGEPQVRGRRGRGLSGSRAGARKPLRHRPHPSALASPQGFGSRPRFWPPFGPFLLP